MLIFFFTWFPSCISGSQWSEVITLPLVSLALGCASDLSLVTLTILQRTVQIPHRTLLCGNLSDVLFMTRLVWWIFLFYFFFFFEDQGSQGSLPGIMIEGTCYWCDEWLFALIFDHLAEVYLLCKVPFIQPSFLILKEGEPWALLLMVGGGDYLHKIFGILYHRVNSPQVWDDRVADFGAGWNAAEKCQGLALHNLSTKSESPTYFTLISFSFISLFNYLYSYALWTLYISIMYAYI